MTSRPLVIFALFGLALLPACSEPVEPIETYTVPKKQQLFDANHANKAIQGDQSGAGKTTPKDARVRMLALIVVDEANSNSWFFKWFGPADRVQLEDVGEKPSPFLRFVDSIKFANGVPEWKLPEEWKQLPAEHPRNHGFVKRFATIVTGGEAAALQLTVTRLPRGTLRLDQDILRNVNRWRKEAGLKDTTLTGLYRKPTDDERKSNNYGEVVKRTIAGKPAFLVNLVGPGGAGGRRPPFVR